MSVQVISRAAATVTIEISDDEAPNWSAPCRSTRSCVRSGSRVGGADEIVAERVYAELREFAEVNSSASIGEEASS
jgi:hypothetical protein